MTTKQEIKLCGMLVEDVMQHAYRTTSDASDHELVFAPIVIMAALRNAKQDGEIDGHAVGSFQLALMDVRAPSFMPAGLIGHILGQALQATRGETIDGARTEENTIAGNTGLVPGAEGSMQ